MRASLFLFLSLTTWSTPAAAQSVVAGPVPSVLFTSATLGPLRIAGLAEPADSIDRDIRPTYWKEGALVGALAGIAGGALVGLVACSYSDEAGKSCTGSAALGALGGALILAIPGALIGGQMHKDGAAE